MPGLTTQQAAELTGKNRSTIWRACKSGRLSATKSDDGDYLIDPAELERVYGTLRGVQPPDALRHDALQPDATTNETNGLRREVEMLREQVRVLTADKDDLRTERDRLIGVLERNAEHMRFLTDQRERVEDAARQEVSRPSFLARWFGRRA